MRLAAALAITALVVVLGAGCGSGSSSTHYNIFDVRDCLKQNGISNVETPSDLGLAPSGSEGNITFNNAGDVEVDLTFGRDASEAKATAEAAKQAAGAFGGGDASDVIRTKGNVTYWTTGTDPAPLS